MRPVSVFAKGPGSEIEQLRDDLHGRWRQATRAVMILLSWHGLAPAQIAELLDCHPATVRRWIGRFNAGGAAGLADRPRSGRPRLGGRRLTSRIAALLGRPGPWTLPRIRRYLGWPQVSMRTLYRRVRLVAVWRRPELTAHGDPDHDHVVAGIVARLLELPRRAVVLAEDETHLNLLPHVRASWTLRTARPKVPTPGSNRQVTVFGALEVTTGAWAYRLGKRCAADFIALLEQVLAAFPSAPVIAVICDNDSIHHARAVTAYLDKHPRLELLYGARYSPHDNPVERIWGALKNYVANTAVTWPARLRQIHSFFRNRSPGQMLDTAAPWTSPWLPPGYEQNFWNAVLVLDGVLGGVHFIGAREVRVDDDFPCRLQAVLARWSRRVGLTCRRQREDFAIVGPANLNDVITHRLYSAMKLEAAIYPAVRPQVRDANQEVRAKERRHLLIAELSPLIHAAYDATAQMAMRKKKLLNPPPSSSRIGVGYRAWRWRAAARCWSPHRSCSAVAGWTPR
jgi:transposase